MTGQHQRATGRHRTRIPGQALGLCGASKHNEPRSLAGGIARTLRWRISGPELNKFVRKLHSRGWLGRKDRATDCAFPQTPLFSPEVHSADPRTLRNALTMQALVSTRTNLKQSSFGRCPYPPIT